MLIIDGHKYLVLKVKYIFRVEFDLMINFLQ